MKIGLVGLPGTGKSTVFGALTGIAVETGYAGKGDKGHLGVVKVPDPRVDALSELYKPKKTTYAETTFSDLAAGSGEGLERSVLNQMRNVDALCQVLRAFENDAGDAPDPLREVRELETETILADLEIIEQRADRLRKDRSNPRELELLERVQAALEEETPVRRLELSPDEKKV
ncbi:MAG: redox-regulated ATPase YchF, partial [Myxococcales bacterium]|nr:redox-regulated ATPase YchF [Myxococcales bacterium]